MLVFLGFLLEVDSFFSVLLNFSVDDFSEVEDFSEVDASFVCEALLSLPDLSESDLLLE